MGVHLQKGTCTSPPKQPTKNTSANRLSVSAEKIWKHELTVCRSQLLGFLHSKTERVEWLQREIRLSVSFTLPATSICCCEAPETLLMSSFTGGPDRDEFPQLIHKPVVWCHKQTVWIRTRLRWTHVALWCPQYQHWVPPTCLQIAVLLSYYQSPIHIR